MTKQNNATQKAIEIHPDGHRAVVEVSREDKSYFEALGPDGFSVGVYDVSEVAVSAAHWAWDFLQEEPSIRRLTLMQLIVDKLKVQYPLDSAEVTLGPKDESAPV